MKSGETMNTTKKLLVMVMVALMAALSLMPSTFSWYSHNEVKYGGKIHYEDELDISMKSSANTVTMNTVKSDAKGTDGTANNDSGISLSANNGKAVQYYKTTLDNTGNNDVMVDLETTNLGNNADFYIGTVSPTINEKAYASKAIREKKTGTTTRVYFKTNSAFSGYWNQDHCKDYEENGNHPYSTLNSSATVGSSNGTTCDMNIAYKISGEANEHYEMLERCPNTDSTTYGGTNRVFYCDLPNNVEYFYFFNHWYFCASTDREWNRTIDITTHPAGTLYYLTGNKVDNKWKEYAALPIDSDLAALNEYYSSAQMSLGSNVFADLGLKRDDDNDENFIPQYYGQSITYESKDTSKATVNKDGLVTPVASTGINSINIETTITGKFGDRIVVTTKLKIPTAITQVPIIENVRVPAGESVVIHWYALNKSTSAAMSTSNIFFTL